MQSFGISAAKPEMYPGAATQQPASPTLDMLFKVADENGTILLNACARLRFLADIFAGAHPRGVADAPKEPGANGLIETFGRHVQSESAALNDLHESITRIVSALGVSEQTVGQRIG